jgi:hypothetical protein
MIRNLLLSMGYGPCLVYRRTGLGDGFPPLLYGEFLEE